MAPVTTPASSETPSTSPHAPPSSFGPEWTGGNVDEPLKVQSFASTEPTASPDPKAPATTTTLIGEVSLSATHTAAQSGLVHHALSSDPAGGNDATSSSTSIAGVVGIAVALFFALSILCLVIVKVRPFPIFRARWKHVKPPAASRVAKSVSESPRDFDTSGIDRPAILQVGNTFPPNCGTSTRSHASPSRPCHGFTHKNFAHSRGNSLPRVRTAARAGSIATVSKDTKATSPGLAQPEAASLA